MTIAFEKRGPHFDAGDFLGSKASRTTFVMDLARVLFVSALLVGCSTELTPRGGDGDAARSRDAAEPSRDAATEDDARVGDVDAAAVDAAVPCTTRITYGNTWIRGGDHPAAFDDAAGRVTWDGVCTRDGGNSYATLSNGWRPYFVGPSGCVMGFESTGSCDPAPPTSCTTRITYGPSWARAPGHPADYDEVSGVVTWDGDCLGGSGARYGELSTGWQPHFSDTCEISIRYEQCGGLFANPVVDVDCPDPGVVFDGTEYVMACTGGGYALRSSTDLVHWTSRGVIFPSAPSWASDSFWAPEIHQVGDHWMAYFSARNRADGRFALGAATAPSALGPFTDIGRPLLVDPTPGIIDVHEFDAPDGRHFLLWKVDGNAVGAPTPIYIQEVAADGVTLMGSRTEILRNDRSWEGDLVEGAWMIFEGGYYYLFYSGNGYATTRYATGVARATDPRGPFTKASAPILVSNSAFGGPGHGSIVRGPSGEWVYVYHSWVAGHVGEAPGRLVLVDRISWRDGWPHLDAAPSPRSQPLP